MLHNALYCGLYTILDLALNVLIGQVFDIAFHACKTRYLRSRKMCQFI